MLRALARAITRILLVVLVATGVGAGYLGYHAALSLPDYGGDRVVAGADARIEIIRDARAVPHIFAQTRADAYFGLGYVHAQDRLWQMALRRRLAMGRLSEIGGVLARRVDAAAGAFGAAPDLAPALLRADILARTLDLYGAAAQSLETFSPEAKTALQAYADGVNARLAEIQAGGLGAGAPELWLLGVRMAPWRPVDSVAALKLLAATLSANVFREIERARFTIALGPEATADLFPDDAAPARLAPPPYDAAREARRGGPGPGGDPAGDRAAGTFGRLASALGAPFAPDAPFWAGASNAWAADAARSASGAPLLASDPHLALTAPSIWYAARLEFPAEAGRAQSVIGGTTPGVPAVLVGRNDRLAWAMTTFPADVGDLYLEQLDPEAPGRYRDAEGWRVFETREEIIDQGGGRAVAAVIRRTRRGPVLPLDWPGVAEATPDGHALSIAWTPLAGDDRSLEAVMGLMRAVSTAEAAAFAPMVVAPTQAVIAADAERIAMFTVGRVPLRDPAHETRGRLPARAWRAQNAWAGSIPADQTPRALDPPGGLLATANNKLSDAPFPRHFGHDWAAPYRIRRLERLLNRRDRHSLESFRAIQADVGSEMAATVAPLLLGAAAAAQASGWAPSAAAAEALERLARWDHAMAADAPEPLIFSEWLRRLATRLTAEPLGDLAEDYAGMRAEFVRRAVSAPAAAARWCGGSGGTPAERCAAVAAETLEAGVAALADGYGARLSSWRWGGAHRAVHRHSLFGAAPGIGALVNIVHPSGGGDHTLNRGRMRGRGPAPFRNVHASGFRALYDFADLDQSLFVIATGQSGHVMSRHYDDFSALWRQGGYAPMSLSRRDLEPGAVGVTRLSPAL